LPTNSFTVRQLDGKSRPGRGRVSLALQYPPLWSLRTFDRLEPDFGNVSDTRAALLVLIGVTLVVTSTRRPAG